MTNSLIINSTGISGSLTNLADGTSYLVAGEGVSITSQSNGSIKIEASGSAVGPFPTYVLPSSSIVVSQSMASDFYLNDGILTTSSYATVNTTGALAKQVISFWIEDTDYSYSINNATGSIFTSEVATPVKVDVQFSGTDWELFGFKCLVPTFENELIQMGLLLDLNPAVLSTLTVTTGSLISISNAAVASGLAYVMSSSGHSPTWNATGWNASTPSIQFAGTDSYPSYTPAVEYLINDVVGNPISELLSVAASAWKTWTFICVFQVTSITSARETGVFSFVNVGGEPTGLLTDYVNPPGEFNCIVYSDTGSAAGVGPSGDDNKHFYTVSSDGAGHLNFWIDGTQVGTNITDVSPRTMTSLMLGAEGVEPSGQFNGQIARFMVFDTNLTTAQRNVVMNYLSTVYGIAL